MEVKSLGEQIKVVRLRLRFSLRKFAESVGIAPSFLSDIELGRRFPSDDVLTIIAEKLDVEFEELKSLDVRESVSEIRRMVNRDAKWGMAFRMVEEKARHAGLTADELMRRLEHSNDT